VCEYSGWKWWREGSEDADPVKGAALLVTGGGDIEGGVNVALRKGREGCLYSTRAKMGRCGGGKRRVERKGAALLVAGSGDIEGGVNIALRKGRRGKGCVNIGDEVGGGE
jgi:hypothetical protein